MIRASFFLDTPPKCLHRDCLGRRPTGTRHGKSYYGNYPVSCWGPKKIHIDLEQESYYGSCMEKYNLIFWCFKTAPKGKKDRLIAGYVMYEVSLLQGATAVNGFKKAGCGDAVRSRFPSTLNNVVCQNLHKILNLCLSNILSLRCVTNSLNLCHCFKHRKRD